MATVLVTGGAGFIGSNIAAALAARGDDVIVVDDLGSEAKWRNLAPVRLADILPIARLDDALALGPKAVVHMGAISATTESDVDRLLELNFRASCRIWRWCAANGAPLIYASSAATYGDGAAGFVDSADPQHLARLLPLNAYAWSKHLFDRWAVHEVLRGAPAPPSWAGLKFFNVYGPGEAHKGPQRSVAIQLYEQIARGEPVRLFKSDRAEVADGGQARDFVWVGDCVDIVLWLLERPGVSGLLNVGTGKARSFADLARAVYAAMGIAPDIRYVDMPAALKGRYQYFTEARLERLRGLGYVREMAALEEGVRRYVVDHLAHGEGPR